MKAHVSVRQNRPRVEGKRRGVVVLSIEAGWGFTHVEIERDADDGQKPQDAIEPPDALMNPVSRACCLSSSAVFLTLRQGVQEEIENVDREEGDAVEQE